MQEYTNKNNMILAIMSPSSPETVSSGYQESVPQNLEFILDVSHGKGPGSVDGSDRWSEIRKTLSASHASQPTFSEHHHFLPSSSIIDYWVTLNNQ